MEKKPTTLAEFIEERNQKIRAEFFELYDPDIHKASPFLRRLAKKYKLSVSRIDQIIKQS